MAGRDPGDVMVPVERAELVTKDMDLIAELIRDLHSPRIPGAFPAGHVIVWIYPLDSGGKCTACAALSPEWPAQQEIFMTVAAPAGGRERVSSAGAYRAA